MKKYLPYHCHTTYSVLDSTTQPEDYVNKAVELGYSSVCFTEHGNVYNWIKKKQLCDKAGVKYIHGVEMYLTSTLEEKIRDNYHVILIAKNKDGVDELNSLISLATDEYHMYYNPRISFDEYFSISKNIIKISACLGGVLNKYSDKNSEVYKRFVDSFDFLEIQPHKHQEQVEYNKFLSELGKPLIAGTDTHEISEYKMECRKILMKGKGQSYGDEDSFDLVYKTYEELLDAFKQQASLPEQTILDAIENTNVLDSMIEDFELDYSFKYPSNYADEKSELSDKVYKMIELISIPEEKIHLYVDRIEEELKAFEKVGMSGFILGMSETSQFCKDNGIPVGAGRGSVTGSLVCFILGITDVDPIVWRTNFSRFVNENRISLGDIDTDFAPDDRDKVYSYIEKKSGEWKSSRIATFQKLGTKSIIDDVSRALGIDLQEVANIKKGYEALEAEEKLINRIYDNGGIDEDERDERLHEINIKIDEYINQFDSIFYYYKGLKGTISSVGFHPCGILSSPVNLKENVGLRFDKKNLVWVAQCDMKCVDSLNYVKYDILSLKTLAVIRDACRLANIDMPTASTIDFNDRAVYEDMLVSPVGLFQMESKSTFQNMSKFIPQSVEDIATVNAIIRPACDSFRDKAIAKELNKNPSEVIDELLKSSYGYLVFQEQIIDFLQIACGFSGSEADEIRRYVGKKDLASLDKALPRIEDGYIANSDKDESTARQECKQFVDAIKSAGSYSFSFNHSVAYSMITYMTAYIRYYHPTEFITAYLNNATNDEDIVDGTNLALIKGVKINNPKFGKSGAEYSIIDGEIYKGIKSVLYVSEKCSDSLMKLSKQPITDFHSLAEMISADPHVDTRQMKVLIKIDFFSDFGKARKLFEWYLRFVDYSGRKTFKKEGIPVGTERIIKSFISSGSPDFSETEKMYKVNSKSILDKIFHLMKDVDFETKDRVINQLSYLGYVQDQELKSMPIGSVITNRTKNDSYLVEGQGWLKFSEEIEQPKKGQLIMINLKTKVKKGRFLEDVVLNYDVLELDRNKK